MRPEDRAPRRYQLGMDGFVERTGSEYRKRWRVSDRGRRRPARQRVVVTPHEIIGGNLKAARKDRGMTQDAAAKAAGISPNHYSRIERGLVDAHLHTYVAVAEAVGLTVAEAFRNV